MQKRICVGDFPLGEEEKKAINEVLEKGRISEWEKVNRFEQEWAKFIGTKYAVALNSGTSALIAGLSALKYLYGIKPGSKVITTPLTYIATSNSIVNTNLQPVFVDVDKETFVITPQNIKEHLEGVDNPEEYSILLPVHLMGYCCDMDGINQVAKKYGLTVFEDSAQAHGSVYKGKKAGSLSALSAYSFYIAHNIQAGEMGALNSDNYEIIGLVKSIKSNGRMCDCRICTRPKGKCPKLDIYKGEEDFDPRFSHDIVGYNFRVMEFQAALALTQLKRVDWIIKQRQENVRYLNEGLEGYSDMLQLPVYSDNVSYLAYPLVIKNPDRILRKKIRSELEKNSIETRPLFGCIPTQQKAYSHLRELYKNKLPNAEYLGSNGFYIGCHQYLKTPDLDYVISVFKEILKKIESH